jgi:hypothetical protein
MGVGGQRHDPVNLPPGKIRYPMYRRLGGPQSRSGQVRKISPPIGIRSPDRPASNTSLYRLRYPDSRLLDIYINLSSFPSVFSTKFKCTNACFTLRYPEPYPRVEQTVKPAFRPYFKSLNPSLVQKYNYILK